MDIVVRAVIVWIIVINAYLSHLQLLFSSQCFTPLRACFLVACLVVAGEEYR